MIRPPVPIDHRPWGHYEILFRGTGFQVKRIQVDPGLRFSLQKHLRREEKWIIVSGKGMATIGGGTQNVERGSLLEVPLGTVHRLQNTGTEPLVFIEVQFGDYLEEDDIVRLEDDFKRV